MRTIQIVLDQKLLRDTDAAAKKGRMNRSALIRLALQKHLIDLRRIEAEEKDRRGYLAKPQRGEEFAILEETATWPEE